MLRWLPVSPACRRMYETRQGWRTYMVQLEQNSVRYLLGEHSLLSDAGYREGPSGP